MGTHMIDTEEIDWSNKQKNPNTILEIYNQFDD